MTSILFIPENNEQITALLSIGKAMKIPTKKIEDNAISPSHDTYFNIKENVEELTNRLNDNTPSKTYTLSEINNILNF